MNPNKPQLSIVTPAYNRGELLGKCYESLCAQTSYDFEWILVDDGSTDDTQTIGEGFSHRAEPFLTVYVRKENGGKHTALNAAHPYIRGKYVLILDSDDLLTPDAVETVLQHWRRYENDAQISMMIFLKENARFEPLAYVKEENKPVNLLKCKRICVHSSDCCEVIRTEWFLRFPFPVFPGERFLAETALWNRVGEKTLCIYINKPIYVCEYLDGGLSNLGRRMRLRNPLGGKYTSYLRMNRNCRIPERIKGGILYWIYGYFAGCKTTELLRESHPYRLLTLACLVPGRILYRLWKKNYNS